MKRIPSPVRLATLAVGIALALTAVLLAGQPPRDAAAQAGAGNSGQGGEGRGSSGQEGNGPTEGTTPAARPSSPESGMAEADGRQLYLTGCISCHGPEGKGTLDGPALVISGEAKTDFYLRTGRMPLAVPGPQPPTKPPAYDDRQIKALVAYVGSLCDRSRSACPTIPDVSRPPGSIDRGNALFLANCAPCHNSMAVGGALSYGRHAPSLQQTPAVQVAEAIRTGPGQMPRFGSEVLTDEQVNSIVTYVQSLHQPESPGGFPLGYVGPVAEGFVALLLGLGALLLVSRWITREPTPGTAPVRPTPIARTEP